MFIIRVRGLSRRAKLPLLIVFQSILLKEAKLLTRYIGSLFTIVAMPFMMSGIFIGIGFAVAGASASSNFAINTGVQNPVLYLTLGGILMISSMVMIENTSSVIREEQLIGTFELHYLTPNNTVLLWLFHATAQSILMLVVFTLDLTVVVAMQGSLLSPVDWLIASLIILLGLLPLAGIGLIVAALTVRFKEVWAVASTLNSFIAMLSGFYYPLEIFPSIVQAISSLLPTSHASLLLRGIVQGRAFTMNIQHEVVIMVFLGLIYLLLGKSFYTRWEDEARRKGELAKY